MMPPSSFNLPYGVTPADIDRHCGGDDPYPDEGPYTVDVPGDLSFSQVGHFTLSGAKRHADEVGGVVLDEKNAVIYGHCRECGDGWDSTQMRDGRCPECTLAAINAAKPEPAWANDARAWLRDIGANAGLPFVGASLPTREERLAKLRADLREQFGYPADPPQDSATRAAYIDASTARIVAHTRRVVASATDEEDVQW